MTAYEPGAPQRLERVYETVDDLEECCATTVRGRPCRAKVDPDISALYGDDETTVRGESAKRVAQQLCHVHYDPAVPPVEVHVIIRENLRKKRDDLLGYAAELDRRLRDT